jgi:hypothetical protein
MENYIGKRHFWRYWNGYEYEYICTESATPSLGDPVYSGYYDSNKDTFYSYSTSSYTVTSDEVEEQPVIELNKRKLHL